MGRKSRSVAAAAAAAVTAAASCPLKWWWRCCAFWGQRWMREGLVSVEAFGRYVERLRAERGGAQEQGQRVEEEKEGEGSEEEEEDYSDYD